MKLGTGGLSRAYSSGVKLALDTLPTEPKIDRVAVEIVIPYENVTDLHRIMNKMEVLVEAEEYGERVEFRAAVPTEAFDSFSAVVADVTGGSGSVTRR